MKLDEVNQQPLCHSFTRATVCLIQHLSDGYSLLFPGALEQFVPSLELVNRKLPYGLAEAGLCFQPSDGSGW